MNFGTLEVLIPSTHRTYRAYRGAEAPANTDHVLVAADLVFTIMKPKKSDEVRRPYDVDLLSSSSELQQHYNTTVQSKFDVLGTRPDDVASQWE